MKTKQALRWGSAPAIAAVVMILTGLGRPETAQARAQQTAAPKAKVQVVSLKSPVPYQVIQRDRNGTADISFTLEEGVEDAQVVGAFITGMGQSPRFEDGLLRGVPTGGPYNIGVQVRIGSLTDLVSVSNVYVGDLWVLAGQSNMEGVGDLVDVTPPDPNVLLLGMDGKWSIAREPLHWLVDSPDVVHSGNPADRAKRSAEFHRTRAKGAGLGLPFAVELHKATGVPIGLIATAHGGTSMAQWDPAKKGDGGNSLYGSFLRSVRLAGGKVKGVLWYQGESDANADAAKIYPKVFTDFIAAIRSDLGQADLPFYYVQIGRFIRAGDSRPWNSVQDTQRTLVDKVLNTAVVSVVDLELDDLIHVGTPGLKRAGRRLALIAERELYGKTGATTPTLDRVHKGPGNTIVLKFRGVNHAGTTSAIGLKPARHITGFSIRKEDGGEIPLIFDASVGQARDTVVLKLVGPAPEKSFLWYGFGYDPACNLTDSLDMAVPVFGPVPLDDVK